MFKKLINNSTEYESVCDLLHAGFGKPKSYPFILVHGEPPGIGKHYQWVIVYLSDFIVH